MTHTISIPAGSLVVLSGLPGAGKTRLRRLATGLPEGAWVSMDDLRKQVLGMLPTLREGRPLLEVRQDANEAVYLLAKTIVSTRMQHGLTTVVDATNPTDSDRKAWVDLANANGAEHLVLILDTSIEQCLLNMRQREDWVPEASMREILAPAAPTPTAQQVEQAAAKGKTVTLTAPQGFTKTSQFNHQLVTSDTQLRVEPRQVPTLALDVVGDVHGLLADMLALLEQAGWSVVEGVLRHADPARKVLFLGDLVDRGPDSIEVLELVMRSVRAGTALCILGNHEHKLVKFVDQACDEGVERWGSFANAETGMKLMKLPAARRDALVEFMRHLPAYYTCEQYKVAFVHGDVHRFDPYLSLKGDIVYGQSGYRMRVDSDALYQQAFEAGLNEYFVFRGHIPQTSPQRNIVSLELHAFQKGELRLLRFDQFIERMKGGAKVDEAVSRALVVRKCDFDFDAYSAKQFQYIKALEDLTTKKLVRRYLDPSKLFRGYKYSKEVFWKGSWDESEWLLKARGIVLDAGGNIVSNPFDKVFNYGERGTGLDLPDDTPVVEVLKLNGFLGIISPNPVQRGELLVHTQGSLDPQGEFTQFILDLLTPKQRGLLAKMFAQRPMTLMFEVLHPQNPHIVQYGEDMFGLHLIGARGLDFEAPELPEQELDAIAAEVEMRRPWWRSTTLGEVKQRIRDCRDEGSMVREDTETQRCIIKIKSPYYLTTKFLARMSEKKAKHMFGNPKDFKKTQEEELYPVVDAVVARHTVDSFLALSEEQRVSAVRDIVETML